MWKEILYAKMEKLEALKLYPLQQPNLAFSIF